MLQQEKIERPYTTRGKAFTLSAERSHGGYIGRWTCDVCGDTGTSSKVTQTADEAFVEAIRKLGPHVDSCAN